MAPFTSLLFYDVPKIRSNALECGENRERTILRYAVLSGAINGLHFLFPSNGRKAEYCNPLIGRRLALSPIGSGLEMRSRRKIGTLLSKVARPTAFLTSSRRGCGRLGHLDRGHFSALDPGGHKGRIWRSESIRMYRTESYG